MAWELVTSFLSWGNQALRKYTLVEEDGEEVGEYELVWIIGHWAPLSGVSFSSSKFCMVS